MLKKDILIKELESRDFADMLFEDARNDIDIAIEAVKINPEYYHLLGWEAKSSDKVVKTTLEQDGKMLMALPKPLCHKKDYILLALEHNPELIENNPEITQFLEPSFKHIYPTVYQLE